MLRHKLVTHFENWENEMFDTLKHDMIICEYQYGMLQKRYKKTTVEPGSVYQVTDTKTREVHMAIASSSYWPRFRTKSAKRIMYMLNDKGWEWLKGIIVEDKL